VNGFQSYARTGWFPQSNLARAKIKQTVRKLGPICPDSKIGAVFKHSSRSEARQSKIFGLSEADFDLFASFRTVCKISVTNLGH
jgi:hypothetical protein